MSVANTIGAMFLGTLIASILYGVTCVQSWYYFNHYPSDRWYIKILVIGVLITDSVHEALLVHMMYEYVIVNFGNDNILTHIVWSVDVEVLFNAFTTVIVQSFLAVRIHKLSNKNWFITAVVSIFVLGEFVTSVMFSIMSLPLDTFTKFATLDALSMTINSFSAVGDLVIAAVLCYLLHASRTGFERSDNIIKKLIFFTVNTGVLTSLCAFASLIFILVWRHAMIYIAFYFCIGRLYCNTLLATLNARKGLRLGGSGGERSEDVSLSYHGPGVQSKTNHNVFGASPRVPNNISVKIDTTHEYMRDDSEYLSGDVKKVEVV